MLDDLDCIDSTFTIVIAAGENFLLEYFFSRFTYLNRKQTIILSGGDN